MDFFEPMSEHDALLLGVHTLAFVGDAVHSLYVRCYIASHFDGRPAALHKMESDSVRASAQAALADEWLDKFSETEISVYRRARNATLHHRSKNRSLSDYRRATGFEAVLGYLYLTGQRDRLDQILLNTQICK